MVTLRKPIIGFPKRGPRQGSRHHPWRLRWQQRRFRLADEERYRFYLKLATLIERGATMKEALNAVAQTLAGTKSPVLTALNAWAPMIRQGLRLNEVVRGWVNQRELQLIAAGERTSTTPLQLRRIVEMGKQQAQIVDVMQQALINPFLVSIAVVAILEYYGYVVVPKLTDNLLQMHLSVAFGPIPRSLMAMAGFVSSYGYVVPLLLGGALFTLLWSLPNWKGPMRVVADRFFPFSLYRVFQGASMMFGLGALVDTGLTPQAALEALSQDASPYLRSRLAPIIFGCRRGEFLGDALEMAKTGFPDPEIIIDLRIYSKGATQGSALLTLAQDWVAGTVRSTKALSEHLRVYAQLALFAVLGWLQAGIMLISFDIGNATTSLY